jgi:hypothetical protein
MKLQLKSVGSGTDKDPFRAPLPTYTTMSHDETAKVIVIDVPSHAHPFSDQELANMPTKNHPEHGVIHVPTDVHLSKLHTWFDKRYKERKGEFRAELA